jgi:hypothetical protein
MDGRLNGSSDFKCTFQEKPSFQDFWNAAFNDMQDDIEGVVSCCAFLRTDDGRYHWVKETSLKSNTCGFELNSEAFPPIFLTELQFIGRTDVEVLNYFND